MITDLRTDHGYALLTELLKEASYTPKFDVELDDLCVKQAYADSQAFADMQHNRFSIATPEETVLSALYAAKCAAELPEHVLSRLNEACVLYGLPEVDTEKYAAAIPVSDGFDYPAEDMPEKIAADAGYGTELEAGLLARALLFPEEAEPLRKIAELRRELAPWDMVALVKQADERLGIDTPWAYQRVGSPEYIVFAKEASMYDTVNLGAKVVPVETLADHADMLEGMGLSVDFKEHDAATIKHAMEALPADIKNHIALLLP